MTEQKSAISESSPAGSRASLLAPILSRQSLMILVAVLIIATLVFSKDWLVAAGLAPILIAMLPCLVMCGLGLCMNKMTGGSCENGSPDRKGDVL